MTQAIVSLGAASIVFLFVYGYAYPALFGEAAKKIGSLSLEETIREIKLELAEIGRAPGQTAGLVLKDLKIELLAQNEKKTTATGALAVPVFEETSLKTETSRKLSRGSKITVVFQSPGGEELLEGASEGRLDLSELVLSARNALLATQREGPNLTPTSVDIEVNFVLVKSTTGGARIKAHVVSIGSALEEVETGGNKVILQYRNPALATDQGVPMPPR